jgi:hypothetical protein
MAVSSTEHRRQEEAEMIAVKSPLFKLGQVLATPGALEALAKTGQSVWEFVSRHAAGDWGVVGAEDAEANNDSLKDGSRLLSAYHLTDGTKVWLITEAQDDDGNRAATTLLLPDEY